MFWRRRRKWMCNKWDLLASVLAVSSLCLTFYHYTSSSSSSPLNISFSSSHWFRIQRRAIQEDEIPLVNYHTNTSSVIQKMVKWQQKNQTKGKINQGQQEANKKLDKQQQEVIHLTTITTAIQNTPPNANPRHQQDKEFPFSYIINEPDLCNETVKIINVIPIAPYSISARHRIRKLWGRKEVSLSTGIRTVFFLGVTPSTKLQNKIYNESLAHHDIIQFSFVDSYRNLTLKTLSMLSWSLSYCPRAKWILKSDEDVFVNPFAVTEFINWNPKTDFICTLNENNTVCRVGTECKEKWAVSLEEYPSPTYPTYCDGPGYILSSSMAAKVYSSANKTHPHFIEDAYITGIIAKPYHPHYTDLNWFRFPKKIHHLRRKFWNGHTLFITDLHTNKQWLTEACHPNRV
ncbi:hypothetical protein Pmani_004704 [Petrolisthes manimaculis]|uniref:Hexosyltransferase n=1 Tax=Petrolisthes manimaculis TaxID=1843537 RepID=A0AAE1ULC0_9EUCA|nr:hypothetical protein Pmani_004704 [Petrolisthes manimaculis]